MINPFTHPLSFFDWLINLTWKERKMNKSGGWNYRSVVFEIKDEIFYEIIEVWYDGPRPNGKPNGWAKTTGPHGNTPTEVRKDIELMQKAFDEPILKAKELKWELSPS